MRNKNLLLVLLLSLEKVIRFRRRLGTFCEVRGQSGGDFRVGLTSAHLADNGFRKFIFPTLENYL